MKSRTRLQFTTNVIVALFIASVLTMWLAPAASAQTVTIPSSMDNNEPIGPGDTVEAGFQITTGDSNSGATTVSVTGAIAHIAVRCPNGSSQTITINFPSQSLSVPNNNKGWFPPSDNTYQGKTTAPSNLCGGKQGRTNGTVFTATFGEKCDDRSGDNRDRSGDNHPCCQPVCFRFHDRFHDSHKGSDSGGSWDDDDRSCKQEKECMTTEKRGTCGCEDEEHN
jgi:hypothetical protein